MVSAQGLKGRGNLDPAALENLERLERALARVDAIDRETRAEETRRKRQLRDRRLPSGAIEKAFKTATTQAYTMTLPTSGGAHIELEARRRFDPNTGWSKGLIWYLRFVPHEVWGKYGKIRFVKVDRTDLEIIVKLIETAKEQGIL